MKAICDNNKIGLFSFFSGAGFLDLGFEKTKKYNILFINDIHNPFLEIYKYSRNVLNIDKPRFNFHSDDIELYLSSGRIRTLRAQISDAHKDHKYIGFIGGPPCPDFSIGGKNKGRHGENGRLSEVYIELICKAKPDFFLFENVKGLWRTRKHREFYEHLKREVIKAGYCLTQNLINAIEYGVPQDRDRIILLGFRKNIVGNNNIDKKISEITNFNWNLIKKYNKVETFLLDWPKTHPFSENSFLPEPRKVPLELTVEYWFRKNKVIEHPNSNHYFTPRAGLEKFLTIMEGDDSKKSYKRLHRWRYSPTAAYGNNEVHLHPYKARRISVAEALAVQSLPQNFIIPENISLSNMFKAVGNGVPYLASKGLALSIFKYLIDI